MVIVDSAAPFLNPVPVKIAVAPCLTTPIEILVDTALVLSTNIV